MRIVAGRHRGRTLQAPPGLATRPTSDRAREALMAILEHGTPPLLGARFLDLFAGSGAIGLEAASRGADRVLLVERAPEAVRAIRANLERLGEAGRARLLVADATRLGAAVEPFDLVVLDPPWRSGLAAPTLAALVDGGWLAAGARLVVELAADEPAPALPAGLEAEQERRYGRTRFLFLRASGAAPPRPARARPRRAPGGSGAPRRALASGAGAAHQRGRPEEGSGPC